jgi:uncharacterized repeat protein (TIGR01451 family)
MKPRTVFSGICALGLIVMSLNAPTVRAKVSGGTVVVKPSALNNWALLQEATGTAPSVSSVFVTGPATPPIGIGSLRFTVTNNITGELASNSAAPFTTTLLSTINALSYSTFAPITSVVATLQLSIDLTRTDAITGDNGRIIFDPIVAGLSVVTNTWQTWDAIGIGNKWYATAAAGPLAALCTIASPCTWTQILTAFPNIGFNANNGAILLKAQPKAESYTTNIDNFIVGISGDNTTYDFDPDATVDLQISKSVNAANVLNGQPMTYTITISNLGTIASSAITMTDALPAGTSFITSTANAGGTCNGTTTVNCSFVSLGSGGNAQVTIVVTAPVSGGSITNTATVTTANDISATNNSASVSNFVVKPTILLSKTVGTDASTCATTNDIKVANGTNVTYCYTVLNNGNLTFTAHTLTDTHLGTLFSNQPVTLTPGATYVFTQTVNMTETTTNIAFWQATDGAFSTTANSSATVTVVNPADLVIAKFATPDPVYILNPLTYTIVITNTGPNPATDIQVVDTLPPGVTFPLARAQAKPNIANGQVTFGLPSLASGSSVSFTIGVRAPSVTGIITNTASISAFNDITTTNNLAAITTTVIAKFTYLPIVAK